jgi:arsenate reductase
MSDLIAAGLTSTPTLEAHEAVLRQLSQQLAERFAGVFAAETVERYVFESYVELARPARITTHLPSLTARFATDRLTALAQSEGTVAKDVPEVLFVCVHNAGRSQIAAAILNQRAGGRAHARSAGSTPAAEIHPIVRDVLAERGFVLTDEFPKPLTDAVVRAADVVVTTNCGDACPVYPGKRYEDWPVADPDGQDADAVRGIVDDIDTRVRRLLTQLQILGSD